MDTRVPVPIGGEAAHLEHKDLEMLHTGEIKIKGPQGSEISPTPEQMKQIMGQLPFRKLLSSPEAEKALRENPEHKLHKKWAYVRRVGKLKEGESSVVSVEEMEKGRIHECTVDVTIDGKPAKVGVKLPYSILFFPSDVKGKEGKYVLVLKHAEKEGVPHGTYGHGRVGVLLNKEGLDLPVIMDDTMKDDDSFKEYGERFFIKTLTNVGTTSEAGISSELEKNWAVYNKKRLDSVTPYLQARKTHEGKTVVTMIIPLISGRDASDFIDSSIDGSANPPTASDIYTVYSLFVEKVAEIHRLGIAHLDLKPPNTKADKRRDGFKVGLVDYGNARHLEGASHFLMEVLKGSTIEFCGAEMYFPGNHKLGPTELLAIDCYAVGMSMLAYYASRSGVTFEISRDFRLDPSGPQSVKVAIPSPVESLPPSRKYLPGGIGEYFIDNMKKFLNEHNETKDLPSERKELFAAKMFDLYVDFTNPDPDKRIKLADGLSKLKEIQSILDPKYQMSVSKGETAADIIEKANARLKDGTKSMQEKIVKEYKQNLLANPWAKYIASKYTTYLAPLNKTNTDLVKQIINYAEEFNVGILDLFNGTITNFGTLLLGADVLFSAEEATSFKNSLKLIRALTLPKGQPDSRGVIARFILGTEGLDLLESPPQAKYIEELYMAMNKSGSENEGYVQFILSKIFKNPPPDAGSQLKQMVLHERFMKFLAQPEYPNLQKMLAGFISNTEGLALIESPPQAKYIEELYRAMNKLESGNEKYLQFILSKIFKNLPPDAGSQLEQMILHEKLPEPLQEILTGINLKSHTKARTEDTVREIVALFAKAQQSAGGQLDGKQQKAAIGMVKTIIDKDAYSGVFMELTSTFPKGISESEQSRQMWMATKQPEATKAKAPSSTIRKGPAGPV